MRFVHDTGNLRVLLRYNDVVMYVPVEVAARAREAAATHNIDAIVSHCRGTWCQAWWSFARRAQDLHR
jgi:hypothetical protein